MIVCYEICVRIKNFNEFYFIKYILELFIFIYIYIYIYIYIW